MTSADGQNLPFPIRDGRGQAKSLIVTVFGDAILPRGGRIWLGSLARLLAPLGLNERLIRTTLSRLVQDHWLRVIAEGRRSDYALSTIGQARFAEASALIYAIQPPAWDGHWRFLLLVEDLPASARESLKRALFWQGFGQLGQRDFVHPTADLGAALSHLEDDNLGRWRSALLPIQGQRVNSPISARDADLVGRAWNLAELAQRYQSFLHTYRSLDDGGAPASSEAAFLLRTWLIHDYRRLLLRDPQLPPELLPEHWPGTLARALTARLYARCVHASERHLDAHMIRADGNTPTALDSLHTRFVNSPQTV